MKAAPILVTGATGYVGGRLIPRLLTRGYRVRATARSLEKLANRPWAAHPAVELAETDILDHEAMNRAAQGCRAAFYLVHSMVAEKGRFADADRRGAQYMAAAAAQAGLERIIYLGGLGEITHRNISPHLKSRHEVGEILQRGPVPATVLRAAMILGSGSASFEILRYLVERLPVMLTPRWVHTPSQPIAIGNVVNYLMGCLEGDTVLGQTYDIGGPDILSYRDLIDIYAQTAQLRPRRVVPVPVLSPWLSAKWIHLVTPVPAAIAQPLTEGLSIPTVCKDHRIRSIIPQDLISCRSAMEIAIASIKNEQVETCWSDAGALKPPEWAVAGDAGWAGGTILECGYRIVIAASASEVWETVRTIGGKNGYYFGNRLWWLRGLMDRLAGGVGLRRGRRHPREIRVGDALDFWRVGAVEKERRLLLVAEMKVPGDAVLDIRVLSVAENISELQMLSRFVPRGLGGILYWYALYPLHRWLFRRMLSAMAARIEKPLLKEPEFHIPECPAACPTSIEGPEG